MSSIHLVFRRPARLFADVLRDREGAVAVLLAIALSAIVGFAGPNYFDQKKRVTFKPLLRRLGGFYIYGQKAQFE